MYLLNQGESIPWIYICRTYSNNLIEANNKLWFCHLLREIWEYLSGVESLTTDPINTIPVHNFHMKCRKMSNNSFFSSIDVLSAENINHRIYSLSILTNHISLSLSLPLPPSLPLSLPLSLSLSPRLLPTHFGLNFMTWEES